MYIYDVYHSSLYDWKITIAFIYLIKKTKIKVQLLNLHD